ncbi:rhomboid family intramembrane serine protease [Lacticaseibacillus hegangensis]|uniref:Rhomboid family intramembrane serine protease n=1 Tax=Lacticaseibacillus hegangensis TaxID=2486010 RepID=A0ABW4CVW9_9LACO
MQYSLRRLKNQPYMTYALFALTVLVFLLETVNGGSTNNYVLVRFGARWNPLIEAGQWWRLITPIFVHIGIMHILVNGVTLFYLGSLTERIFGHWRFLVLYLVSGFTGNLASAAFNPTGLAAGASTALFGMMGAYLMLYDGYRDNAGIRAISRQFVMLAALNIVFDLFMTGVDIYGHIGGFIGGFLIAYALGAPNLGETSMPRRVGSLFALVAASAALLIFAFGSAL